MLPQEDLTFQPRDFLVASKTQLSGLGRSLLVIHVIIYLPFNNQIE